MSVPTTLQGTHDGCGGLVVFRPATHRRELLAGATIVLRAACRDCGATLATEYSLPTAQQDSWSEAEPEAVEQPLEYEMAQAEAMPVAAGAEDWQPATAPVVSQQARPTADLGSWRMRGATRTPLGLVDVDREDTPTAQLASAPQPDPKPTSDPHLDVYMNSFARRVATARENLDRASTGLPSALAGGDGDAGFRSPRLARGISMPQTGLTGDRAPASSVAPALTAAIAAPTFHGDMATAAAPAAAPALEPAPAVAQPASRPAVRTAGPVAPAPAFALRRLSMTTATEVTEALPAEPIVAPIMLAPVAAPVEEAPVVRAPLDHGHLAPTDADVLPPLAEMPAPIAAPVVLAALPAPGAAEPVMAAMAPPAPPAPPAPADVWATMPGAPAMPPAPPAPAAPAMPEPATPLAPPAPDTFAAALGDFAPPASTPMDISVAADPDRGFNWGSDDEALDTPKKGRSFNLRRAKAAKDATGSAEVLGAGAMATGVMAAAIDGATLSAPEVVFEPSPDPDAAPARTRLGLVEIIAIVLLAAFAGVAGFKVMSTKGDLADAPAAVQQEVAPAEVTPPPAAPVTPAKALTPAQKKAAAAKKAAALKKAAAAKKAAALKKAAAPPAPATAPPGAPVGNDGSGASALADAAGTAASSPASDDAGAQESASAADAAVVTAAAADDTNPFVRP